MNASRTFSTQLPCTFHNPDTIGKWQSSASRNFVIVEILSYFTDVGESRVNLQDSICCHLDITPSPCRSRELRHSPKVHVSRHSLLVVSGLLGISSSIQSQICCTRTFYESASNCTLTLYIASGVLKIAVTGFRHIARWRCGCARQWAPLFCVYT